MRTYEVELFGADALKVDARSVAEALDKAKPFARVFGLIIMGVSTEVDG